MKETSSALTKFGIIKRAVVAVLLALMILLFVVLPAEYGIDPTGFGQALGLKDISTDKIVRVINNEQVSEQSVDQTPKSTTYHASYEQEANFLTVELELEPFGQIEYKLNAEKGTRLIYQWQSDGGTVYADLHGHTEGENTVVQYLETPEGTGESGEWITPFAGEHGWYFLNFEERTVTVSLKVGGQILSDQLINLGPQL